MNFHIFSAYNSEFQEKIRNCPNELGKKFGILRMTKKKFGIIRIDLGKKFGIPN
jgi:hypothetical protein